MFSSTARYVKQLKSAEVRGQWLRRMREGRH